MSLNQQYAATLGDLLMRQADVQAESARERARIGNAKGQLWGNFLGGVAKLITEAPQRDLQNQETAARLEELGARTATLKANAQKLNDERASDEALTAAINDPENAGDVDRIYQTVAKQFPTRAQEFYTQAQKFRQVQNGVRQDEWQIIANALQGADKASDDSVKNALAIAKLHGASDASVNQAGQMLDSLGREKGIDQIIGSTPDAIKAKQTAAAKAAEPFTLNQGDVRYMNGQPVASNPKPDAPAPAKSLSQQLAEAKTPDEVKRITGLMRTEALAKHIVDPKVSAPEKPNTDEALALTVIDNPALFDQLTATDKGRISPILKEKGFDQFGRPLPPAAVKQIADTKTAIDSLNDLKQVLKDNEAYIGPIAGLAAMNPYSDAKQAQAKIDLVRQRVGKALEGGVLRKEDEEKYKQILATLRDTPTTAVSKVDSLIHSLQQDVENFIGQQRLSGRRVSQAQADSVKGGQGQNATPAAPAASTGPQVGSVVTYNGKRYRVKSITNGRADLEAVQ